MREIAVSGSSETHTDADRAALDTEVSALETEISRIGDQTTWGGKNILNGTIPQSNPILFHSWPNCNHTIDVTLEL